MKTILVATDFSQAAKNAANYAADMALAIGADLFLLNTFQVPVVYSEAPLIMNLDEMEKTAEKALHEVKDQLIRSKRQKLNIETEVRVGNFFQELKNVCEQINPYVVVMGSQGTSAAERVFFGGHTVHAMKELEWPLITVPLTATFSDMKKICLACDFDKIKETIPVDEVKMLVRDFNASLHVLNTGRQDKYNPEIVFETRLLKEMLAPVNPEYHFISNDNVDQSIMEFAEKNHIDLLIVLPKRYGLLEKITHSSHTKQFVLHSHVPVMSLHHQ